MAHRLLLIEDEETPQEESLKDLLLPGRCVVEQVGWASIGERLPSWAGHLVVAGDVREGRADLVQALRERSLGIPAVAILPSAPSEALVQAAANVFDDFVLSPVQPAELRSRVERLLLPCELEVERVRNCLSEEVGSNHMIGAHPVFLEMIARIPGFAKSQAPVLVTGETGTGKELCARALHHAGARRNAPFIALDCAALPDHLFENEVFGHARGAYTDAQAEQRGLIRMADTGTLFLDEIDALSLAAQAKLLRFLQEKVYKPLGSDRFVRADVNIVAGTNQDLRVRVQQGAFRPDLYFRLNVLRIDMPPLRARDTDVSLLARHFLRKYSTGKDVATSFSQSAMRRLELHDWPGNVRELANVVQRAVVAAGRGPILATHISLDGSGPSKEASPGSFREERNRVIARFEGQFVQDLLCRHAGNVTRAARDAGKDRRAFGRLVKKYCGLQAGRRIGGA